MLDVVEHDGDDGVTWRGAYGPRLRDWGGVDQLDEVRRLLIADPETRRAVMSIFDPARDFVQSSKDIPCNNWLHWLVRDGRLHLNVAVRSNDVMWGFSGVNSFEWSVLHEMMTYWVGRAVGSATYFASSFHLYKRHYERAPQVVSRFPGFTWYDFGVEPAPFATPWAEFGEALDSWFASEARVASDPDAPIDGRRPPGDPLLDDSLRVLRIYHGAKLGWDASRLRRELGCLPATDLAAAAYEYHGRQHPELLDAIPQKSIAEFFAAAAGAAGDAGRLPATASLKATIKALHRRKDAAYRSSWKKRGELLSILPNIARKVDRLEEYVAGGAELDDESLLDTAIDLYVYATKYRLFLFEADVAATAPTTLPTDAPRPFSDHPANFDHLVERSAFSDADPATPGDLVRRCVATLNELDRDATAHSSPLTRRVQLATELADLAARLVALLAADAASSGGAPGTPPRPG